MILFGEAFHSFFFFFSFSFSRRQIMASPCRGEKFLNLVLVIPCLFRCLSPDRISKSVVQSPETARDIFPCASFTLPHFSFFVQQ